MKKDYKLTLFFAMSSIAAAFGQHATAQVFEDGEELHPTIANTTAVKGSENTYLIDDDGPRTPTPRLADGTPDLSGDGYWDLPWVSNFANARDVPREAPWRPWVKSMWEYHTSNDSKFDPEGFLPATGWSPGLCHALPGRNCSAQGQNPDYFRGWRPRLARNLHGWS